MPANLLAICRPNGILQIKKVTTVPAVQNAIETIFGAQEQQFNSGITQDVPFDGAWKPEDDEMLVVHNTPEMNNIWNQSLQNVNALPVLNAANFQSEAIKALAVVAGNDGNRRLLIQTFSARQILDRSFSLTLSGNTFKQITEPSFCIGTSLSGILDATSLRFKSYSNVRTVFDLASLYTAATDAQIDIFAQHNSLHVGNLNDLKNFADQGIRKLINAISSKGTLNNYTIQEITTSANTSNFQINIQNNKILIPTNRSDTKKLLHFLDEGFYRGALSGTAYITNSKRPI